MREIRRDLGNHDDYSPLKLSRNYDISQLRAEYSRMRDNLRRNVSRIEKNGEFPNAQVLKEIRNFSPAGKYDKQQLALKLSELEDVLSANTSTLTGLKEQRKMTIETLQDRGYTNINTGNFLEYIDFMDTTRQLAVSILRYGYDKYGRAVGADRNLRLELFNTAQKKGISGTSLIKDFEFYVKHLDELEKLPDRKKGRKLGIKAIKNRLKQMRENG